MICSVFGHKEIVEPIEDWELYDVCKGIIGEGVDTFFFCRDNPFDELCYRVVSSLKIEFPSIKRILCVYKKKALYEGQLLGDDYEKVRTFMPSAKAWYGSKEVFNRAVIDESDFVLVYAKKPSLSEPYKAYNYAKEKKKMVLNLLGK